MTRSTLPGLRGLLLGLCVGVLQAACAQPAPAAADAAASISLITVERQCFGCPAGERLELHRDGRARLTQTGNARHGTVDRVAEAMLAPGEFDRLARAVQTAGYFRLAERYEEAGVQDGAWVQLTVVRGGTARQVFRRENAGPQALAELLATLDGAKARLAFVPLTR